MIDSILTPPLRSRLFQSSKNGKKNWSLHATSILGEKVTHQVYIHLNCLAIFTDLHNDWVKIMIFNDIIYLDQYNFFLSLAFTYIWTSISHSVDTILSCVVLDNLTNIFMAVYVKISETFSRSKIFWKIAPFMSCLYDINIMSWTLW